MPRFSTGAANLLLGVCVSAAALYAQGQCGTATDLVIRVRERLAQQASLSEYEDLLQLLKRATQLCVGQGDAWYYRALLERKMGREPAAQMSEGKARLFGSEAMANGINPFEQPKAKEPSDAMTSTQFGEVEDKWALIVGIGQFRDRRVPPLRAPAKDARDMAALLTDSRWGRFKPANVSLLTDESATTVRIKSELNRIARSAGKNDLVLLYFSSHGSHRDMDTAGVSYIVTYDTEIENYDSLYATALPMVELADAVNVRFKAQRAVVFLDTCYSGAAVPGSRDLYISKAGVSDQILERIRQGTGRAIITSSSANEKSWESDQLGNGIFTHYLMEALRMDNGLVPLQNAFEHLRDRVNQRVQKEKGTSQTPSFAQSQRAAQIVIGAPPIRK